ncbi:MAG: apolipoprotein N-acyltransferase [Tepidisphaeraceae bacterium]
MRKRSRRSQEFRRAGAAATAQADATAAAAPRWYADGWMPMCSAVLMTLAFAPISQFYLAWVGLVPWLMYVRRATGYRRLFLWNWAAGAVFFGLNIWWLGFVTIPGTMGSVVYMGLYWALAAVIVRAVVGDAWWSGGVVGSSSKRGTETQPRHHSTTRPLLSIFAVATIWTATEWVRGNLGSGWPWSFTGYTQTPILAMCQVADVVGVHGVTFWLVAVNGCVALVVHERMRVRSVLKPIAAVGAMLLVVLAYGIVRIAQTHTTPGPRVMVVQANYPQTNTGEKGAYVDEIVAFHVNETRKALQAEHDAGRKVDLVAWSETMMPTINRAALDFTRGSRTGRFLQAVYQEVASLTFDFRTALITGGAYAGKMVLQGEENYIDLDRRNAAYFFESTGVMSDLRYDKVHLVPFGEYVPFKETIPPLYRLFMWFSPYDFDYNLVPGKDDALTVFTLGETISASHPATAPATRDAEEINSSRPYFSPATQPAGTEAAGENRDGSYLSVRPGARFVAPICFEDADPRLLARMFRPDQTSAGRKRADFIVNLTNDGWFSQPQLAQHLQIARFRSIENRVPTARAVNTGISAFIDSVGRVIDRLPTHVEATLVSELPLDGRLTFYTRFGDLFGAACTTLTAAAVAWAIVAARLRRRANRLR